MGRILYLDCFSGVSGDMLLGALFSLGVRSKEISTAIQDIVGQQVTIWTEQTIRGSLSGTLVRISQADAPVDICSIIEKIKNSNLPDRVKDRSISAMELIVEVEKKIHNISEPHLHELGSIDTVVDILGVTLCIELLGVDRIFASEINLGGGTIDTSHGLLPVPAPATAEILKDTPVYGTAGLGELTTPTGAALVKVLVEQFGPLPPGRIKSIGYGAGNRQIQGRANLLRAFLLEVTPQNNPWTLVVETNIDDMNPQMFEHLIESLLGAGALDVFLTPVIMKKSRPATKVTVLCHEPDLMRVSEILFQETTTIGLRYYRTERILLPRKHITLDTPFGPVRFKQTELDGKIQLSPEYEDLKAIATAKKVPLKEVFRVVMRSVP